MLHLTSAAFVGCKLDVGFGHMFIPIHAFGYSLGVKNYMKCLCVVN